MSLDLQPPAAPPAALPLDELLEQRTELRVREEQLSYWRRVVQGRLDLLQARLDGTGTDSAHLAGLLGGSERCGTRMQHSPVRHIEPMLELATADRAWDIASISDDPATIAHAVHRLGAAEQWLSRQRAAALAELDAMTTQLARRLSDDPGAYLRSVERRSVTSAG